MKQILLLTLFSLWLQVSVVAQQNVWYEPDIWTSSYAHCFTKDTNFFVMHLHTRSSTEQRLNTFSQLNYRLQAGFEYNLRLGQKWWLGLGSRVADERVETQYIQRLQLQHTGRIKSLYIIKRLALDWIDYRKSIFSQARLRVLLGVNREFKISQNSLLSLTALAELFQAYDIGEVEIERRYIDMSRFRAELMCDKKNFSIGLFAVLQSRYFFVLPTYKDGQTPPTFGVPTYDKLNIHTPIFGISAYKRIGYLKKAPSYLFRAVE